MTPKEVIDGLKLIKEWDPRAFILDICDAAITYVEPYARADEALAAEKAAEEAPVTSEDFPPAPDATETPAPETSVRSKARK